MSYYGLGGFSLLILLIVIQIVKCLSRKECACISPCCGKNVRLLFRTTPPKTDEEQAEAEGTTHVSQASHIAADAVAQIIEMQEMVEAQCAPENASPAPTHRTLSELVFS
jgi:hypothetical protein